MTTAAVAGSVQGPVRHLTSRQVQLAPGRLEEMRKASGLSVKQLAGLLGHGSSEKSISMWELGKWRPGAAQFAKLCRVVHVSAAYLMGESNDPNEAPEVILINGKPPGEPLPIPAPAQFRGVPPGKGLGRIDPAALKAARVRAKLTVRQLSDRTGIAYNTINAWERGQFGGIGAEKLAYVAGHVGQAPEVIAGLWPMPDEEKAPVETRYVPPEERIFGIRAPAEDEDEDTTPAVSQLPDEPEFGLTQEERALSRLATKGRPITVEAALSMSVTVPDTSAAGIRAEIERLAQLFESGLKDLRALAGRVEHLCNNADEAERRIAARKAELQSHGEALIELMREKVAELG